MTLFDFDGATYQRPKDQSRLNRHLQCVYDVMQDQKWHAPAELEQCTGFNWASISARLRDLRKPRFGSYTVDRRRVDGGLYEYRLIVEVAA